MPALFMYLLKASLVLTVLYGVYWGLLRNATFYQLNRVVLVCTVCCALLLPGLRVPLPENGMDYRGVLPYRSVGSLNDKPVTAAEAPSRGDGQGVSAQSGAETLDRRQPVAGKAVPAGWLNATTFPFGRFLLVIYLLVTAFFSGKILVELFALLRLARTGSRQQVDACSFLYVRDCIAPLSFFKLIMLNPGLYTPAQLRQIIRHERVHADQWHSLDVLLVESFCALLWFHPLAWLLKKEVKLNLEYIADEQVLREGVNRKEYQYHLLRMSAPEAPVAAANYFNFSYLKSRIARMNGRPSPSRILWRYSLLVPAVALLLFSVQPMRASRPAVVQALPKQTAARVNPVVESRPAARAVSGTAVEPTRAQITRTETGPAQADSTQTAPTEPAIPALEPVTPSAGDEPVSALRTSAQLPGIGSVGIQPVSTRIDPPQTTTASALDPYLKLEGNQSVYLAIRASLSENDLEEVARHLRETGVDIQFTHVTYNAEKRLTRIRMQVTVGDCSASGGACFGQTIEAYNGGEPLQHDKPLVFYLSRRIDKVGVSYGYPKELSGNDLSALRHVTGSMVGMYGGG